MFQVRSWIGAALVSACLTSAAVAQGAPPTIPPWSDGWEAYAAGIDPTNPSVGNWEQWDLTVAFGAQVSTTQAHTGTKSLKNGGNSDVVQKYSTPAGVWIYTAWIYVPYQNATDPDAVTIDTWFILLNTFQHGAAAPKNWSLQLQFDPRVVPPTVAYGFHQAPNTGVITTFTTDKWIEIRCEIDLNLDMCTVFLDGVQFGSTFPWTSGVSGGGLLDIQCVDLWSNLQNTGTNPNGGAFYDDLSLLPEGTPTTTFCTPKTGLVCGTPSISATGISSATAASGFNVNAAPARSCRNGVLVYSTGGQTGAVPFQGGFACQGQFRRAAPIDSGGTPGNNCDGVFTIDFNAFMNVSWVNGGCNPNIGPQTNPHASLVAGATVHSFMWGRDSVATGSYVSDSITWTIGP